MLRLQRVRRRLPVEGLAQQLVQVGAGPVHVRGQAVVEIAECRFLVPQASEEGKRGTFTSVTGVFSELSSVLDYP